MAYAIGKFGLATLTSLGSLIALFYVTSLLFVVVVLGGFLAAYVRLNIFQLFRYLKDEFFLVLGTSTAEPALLGLMRKLTFLGADRATVGLVVPTGYSFNLDGAAIYLSLASLYIAQATDTPAQRRPAARPACGHAADVEGRCGRRRRRLRRADRDPVHSRHCPLRRHHADLRHRQVHVRVPGALVNFYGNAVATLVIAKWDKALDLDRARQVLAAHTAPDLAAVDEPVPAPAHPVAPAPDATTIEHARTPVPAIR